MEPEMNKTLMLNGTDRTVNLTLPKSKTLKGCEVWGQGVAGVHHFCSRFPFLWEKTREAFPGRKCRSPLEPQNEVEETKSREALTS